MSDPSKIAKNLERFRVAVFRHDELNPTHTAYGVGMSAFDAERLGLEHGEELWPGIRLEIDGGPSGMCRVLCDGQHDGEKQAEAETVRAVGQEVYA
jgi:hypothetical protein